VRNHNSALQRYTFATRCSSGSFLSLLATSSRLLDSNGQDFQAYTPRNVMGTIYGVRGSLATLLKHLKIHSGIVMMNSNLFKITICLHLVILNKLLFIIQFRLRHRSPRIDFWPYKSHPEASRHFHPCHLWILTPEAIQVAPLWIDHYRPGEGKDAVSGRKNSPAVLLCLWQLVTLLCMRNSYRFHCAKLRHSHHKWKFSAVIGWAVNHETHTQLLTGTRICCNVGV
jgi:hypothetical protein